MNRRKMNQTHQRIEVPSIALAGILIATVSIVAGCTSAGAPAGAKAFKPLFNGRDLTGWTIKCKPADLPKGFWKVDDGTIVADSKGHKGHDYVWLVTNEEYSDFVLRLRFQAHRNSPGNSGVQLRSRYDDQAGWLDGPQIDINPPGPWRTGMIWDETRGVSHWLWPNVPKGKWVNQSMANPDMLFYYSGQAPGWNDLEITAIGTRLTAVLNGITVMEYDGSGVLNDNLHNGRNVGMKGHIALQIHKNDQLEMRFKDIYIRDLSK